MRKMTITVLSLATAAALIGCGASSKITKDNFDKVKKGMTKADVVAILGEPTGDELVAQIGDKEIRGPTWEGPGFKIVTMFSEEGKLLVKTMVPE